MKPAKVSRFFDGFFPGMLWSLAAWYYFLNVLLLDRNILFSLTAGTLLLLAGCLLSRPLLALADDSLRNGFAPAANFLTLALSLALWVTPLQRSNVGVYLVFPLLLAGLLQAYLLSMTRGGDDRRRNDAATAFGGAVLLTGVIVGAGSFRMVCALRSGYEAVIAESFIDISPEGWWMLGIGGAVTLLLGFDLARRFQSVVIRLALTLGCLAALTAGVRIGTTHLKALDHPEAFSMLRLAAIEIPFRDAEEQWRLNDRPGELAFSKPEEIAGSTLPVALMMGDGEYQVLFVGTPFDGWPLPLAHWKGVNGIDWLVDPVFWSNQVDRGSSMVRFLPSQPLFLTEMMMPKTYRLIVLWDHPASYPAMLRQLELVDRLAPGGLLVMPEVTAKAVNAAERFKDRLPFETVIPGPDRLVAFSDRPVENDPARLAERLNDGHPLKNSFEILYSLPASGDNAGPVRFRDGTVNPTEVQNADYIYAPWAVGAVALLFLVGVFLGRKGKRHRLLLAFHCGLALGVILLLLLMTGYRCGLAPLLLLPTLFCTMMPVFLRNSHSGLLVRILIVVSAALTGLLGPEFVIVVAAATALHNGAVCRFLELQDDPKWNEELFFTGIAGTIIGVFVASQLVNLGCGIWLLLAIYAMIELPLLAVRRN